MRYNGAHSINDALKGRAHCPQRAAVLEVRRLLGALGTARPTRLSFIQGTSQYYSPKWQGTFRLSRFTHSACGSRALVPMLAGLAALTAVSAAENTPVRAWPPPPAEPRIVYVRSISTPEDVGAKPSALNRLANWVTGAKQGVSTLVRPFGLALDDSGNLLVTDTGAAAVCCLDFRGRKWLRWEKAGNTRFASPVAVARKGEILFVADSGLGKVLAFDLEGRVQFEITRNLERPSGLALADARLFIADVQRHCVVVTDLKGEFLFEFGSRGGGPGEFNYPTHVAADAAGLLYITDSLNCRVQVFDKTGKAFRVIGSIGDTPGHFSRPKGVAVDNAGHAYVVDSLFDNVQIFDAAGRLLLDWGQTGSEPGEFWLPNAIAISSNNEIYIADSYNRRIQVFRYLGQP